MASWSKVRKQILERDGYTCQGQECSSQENLDVHHITPRSKGGTDAPGNLTTLCKDCHVGTHAEMNAARKAAEEADFERRLAESDKRWIAQIDWSKIDWDDHLIRGDI